MKIKLKKIHILGVFIISIIFISGCTTLAEISARETCYLKQASKICEEMNLSILTLNRLDKDVFKCYDSDNKFYYKDKNGETEIMKLTDKQKEDCQDNDKRNN